MDINVREIYNSMSLEQLIRAKKNIDEQREMIKKIIYKKEQENL